MALVDRETCLSAQPVWLEAVPYDLNGTVGSQEPRHQNMNHEQYYHNSHFSSALECVVSGSVDELNRDMRGSHVVVQYIGIIEIVFSRIEGKSTSKTGDGSLTNIKGFSFKRGLSGPEVGRQLGAGASTWFGSCSGANRGDVGLILTKPGMLAMANKWGTEYRTISNRTPELENKDLRMNLTYLRWSGPLTVFTKNALVRARHLLYLLSTTITFVETVERP